MAGLACSTNRRKRPNWHGPVAAEIHQVNVVNPALQFQDKQYKLKFEGVNQWEEMRFYVKKQAMFAEGHTQSRLKIAVRGFADQMAVTTKDVIAVIERLPSFHLEGLREIVYVRRAQQYPSLGALVPVFGHGEYVQAERTIFVYQASDLALFRHVLMHEVGHHVFFLVINSHLKKNWVTRIYPGSRCATHYGSLNSAEDFAECYALYAQEEQRLTDYPEKFIFMRDCVFSGRPETLKEKNRH